MKISSVVPILLAVPASAMLMGDSCGGSSNNNTPPAPGGTGAFGIVTVGGVQKLYLPSNQVTTMGHGQVMVINAGLPGNGTMGVNALITAIDLGTPDQATATGGDSTTVVAVSTQNNKVWLIDPATDTLKKTLTLDPATFGQSSFSWGGGYVTGIATDSTHHRAILSVWNGFALLDLSAQTIGTVIEAPPSENFGFDSSRQWILAPFYSCSSSTLMGAAPTFCSDYGSDGLNVIDLKDNTVYKYQVPDAGGFSGPVGSEPDPAAADPVSGVVVVPSEGDGSQSVIDFSKASFYKATKTVTAPSHTIDQLSLTGVAIESVGHYAFWEEEWSSPVAVIDLNQANAGTGTALQGNMPDLPDGNSWGNMGDPHGVAVTTGISSGRSVGFVVTSDTQWVGRVDLAKFAALTPTGTFVSDISSAVTFLAVK